MNPAATTTGNIQPNPVLNTNVTWSVFHSGWKPLEYSNGSANLTLDALMSQIYANPVSVNPTDIQANHTLTYDKLGSMTANWTSGITLYGAWLGGAVATTSTANGHFAFTVNTSAASSNSAAYGIDIPIADFPSSNPSYDYATVAYALAGPQMAGVSSQLVFENSTVSANPASALTPGQTQYISISLGQYQVQNKYAETFNTSGTGSTTRLVMQLFLNIPKTTTSADYTLTIYGMAFTDYALSLGQNATGSPVSEATGNARMATFAPQFSWSEVTGNGYSVAVSQPIQNETTQQTPVNSGAYIEQVEYQGQFTYPTAPDLTYGQANITEFFNVSTSQTVVLDINGVSYLSAISGKNNTVQLLSSVDPNGQTQFLQIVDYTQSQWTSISSPPGIFTLAGIEYYWEEIIIAILAIVGVGAGAASRHASNLRKVK